MRFEKIECAGQVLNGSVSICLFGRSECKMCVCVYYFWCRVMLFFEVFIL